jgi:guanosine-3',5'-bis(diphosphate) 3'-pyrophosphohydrolase
VTDKEKLGLASLLAEALHSGQKYGDSLSYTYHLHDVYLNYAKYRKQQIDMDIAIACYLHDSVEDTDMTVQMLRSIFGQRVSQLVDAVTNGEGANRAERHKAVYDKIRNTPGALELKLADRIANVSYSYRTNNKGKLKMYAKEWLEFQSELRVPGELEPMWQALSQILDPLVKP